MTLRFNLSKQAILCTALFALQPVWSADTEQPIEISADAAIREEPSGKTTYSGDVVLTQGGLRINADSLIFDIDSSGASVITATGTPATLTQQATDKSASVDASASNIEYQESAERIRLTGNAKILQAGAVIEGNTIDYEVGTQRVMAAGSLKDDTSQRVKVTLPPSTLRDDQ